MIDTINILAGFLVLPMAATMSVMDPKIWGPWRITIRSFLAGLFSAVAANAELKPLSRFYPDVLRLLRDPGNLGGPYLFWWVVLRRVVAPALMPHLFVAWLFAFAVSFDEVVMTFFIAGSIMTIPKKMFVTLRSEIDPTITAVSTLLIGVTLLIGLVAGLVLQRRLLSVVGTEKN